MTGSRHGAASRPLGIGLLLWAALLGSVETGWGQDLEPFSPAAAIDAYFDNRDGGGPAETEALLSRLAAAGFTEPDQLEELLRSPRASYPDPAAWVGRISRHPVRCEHVSYESAFWLSVPADYRPEKPVPVVVVGHGGNSSMSAERAAATARVYLEMYAPAMQGELGAIVVAPISERGWGQIGNSLIRSTLSRLARMFPIDPDRVYITGQSMGGHLAFRSALTLPDWWGAVSPHSGGYDFVEKGSIGNLLNVPGYAIWGAREPYGIREDNVTNREWGVAHGLDWEFVQKEGGHTIYRDELPAVARFFREHPRDLYGDRVYLKLGGAMKFVKTWEVAGWPPHEIYVDTRPLAWNARYWLEVEPRPEEERPMEVWATSGGENRIEICSDGVRRLKLRFHPRTVDFERPLEVVVNGEVVKVERLEPDPVSMFREAHRRDDRGWVFWCGREFAVASDCPIELDAITKSVD